jgi:hypothetical protein
VISVLHGDGDGDVRSSPTHRRGAHAVEHRAEDADDDGVSYPTSAPRRPTPRPEHPLRLTADGYLTDGRRLFRVVSPLIPGAGRIEASLEDCLTLEVTAYAPEELHTMGLRTVRAAD